MTLEQIKEWVISKPESRFMTDMQINLAIKKFAEFWNWAIQQDMNDV